MKKILVVDDNFLARDFILDWIKDSYEYVVLEASNSDEAKKLISENHFDFIICDYEMPDGNGDEVLNFITSQNKVIPFVFFTGNPDLKGPFNGDIIETIVNKDFIKLFEFLDSYWKCKNESCECDYSKFKGSKKITDQGDLLKLGLIAKLKDVMDGMETQEILSITELDKSDLSRLRISSFERFSIDRLIKVFDQLGFKAEFSVTKK